MPKGKNHIDHGVKRTLTRNSNLPVYGGLRGGQTYNSNHTLAENIRPWTGLKVRHIKHIPSPCICYWAPTDGFWHLKFANNNCPVKHA